MATRRKPPGPVPPGTHGGSGIRQSARQAKTTEDFGLLITEDQLRRFGNGDPAAGRRELRLLMEIDTDYGFAKTPTERPVSVRTADTEDEPALLALWLHDLRANAEHIAPIDENKVLENIQAGTRRRGGITVCIDGPDRTPVAMVVLHPLEWHWSRGYFYQEMVSYVHPDHRRSKHADDLMNYIKWASENMSTRMGSRFYVLCGVLGAWRTRAKIALYRRKFSQIGAAFLWPPPPNLGN